MIVIYVALMRTASLDQRHYLQSQRELKICVSLNYNSFLLRVPVLSIHTRRALPHYSLCLFRRERIMGKLFRLKAKNIFSNLEVL